MQECYKNSALNIAFGDTKGDEEGFLSMKRTSTAISVIVSFNSNFAFPLYKTTHTLEGSPSEGYIYVNSIPRYYRTARTVSEAERYCRQSL